MEVALSCFNAQRQRTKSHAPFEINFDNSLYFQQQQYISIYLIITDCCTYYLRPPRLAPAICGWKWTLCKCSLLIIIIIIIIIIIKCIFYKENWKESSALVSGWKYRGQFNKTFTPAIYKCSHCLRVWKQ